MQSHPIRSGALLNHQVTQLQNITVQPTLVNNARPNRAWNFNWLLVATLAIKAMSLVWTVAPVTPAFAANQSFSVSYCGADSDSPAQVAISTTLAYALANYSSGDTIAFACSGGTGSAYTINITSTININNNLTLNGNGFNVTLNGGNTTQLLNINSGVQFTLNSLTIAHGKAPANNCFGGSYACGGGIYNSGILTVTNSTFTANSAGFTGGAIFNSGTISSLSNSTFTSNSGANFGGAIYNNGGSISDLSNSTFTANSAAFGGAIYNYGTISSLSNSTFTSNSAAPEGGGAIYNYGTISVTNSLFANSTSGGNCSKPSGTFTDGGYNLSDDASTTCFTNANSHNNVTNLNLGVLQNNGGATQTIALLAGSAAIGAAKSNCPAFDQRGMSRVGAPNSCDVGAFQSGIIGNSSSPTASLCTEPALNAALGAGGYIAVYCPTNTTITVTANPNTSTNFRIITSTVTLDASPSLSFTLSGADSFELFNVNNGAQFTLNGLTIAHGKAPASNCFGSYACGGGIYNSGILTATNSIFASNYANDNGGAIYNNDTISSLTNSTFTSNSVGSGGGAIYNNGTISSLTNSTFTSNSTTASYGGGGAILNGGTISNLTNSTFTSNSATDGYGGAIDNNGSISSLTNSTFTSNSATFGGGTILNGGTISVTNSLFANSLSGGNCYKYRGTFTDGGYNLSDDASCGFTATGSHNNVTNLNLDSLKNNGGATPTIALLPGSAALFAGNPANCPATDQRGQSRPQPANTNCDVGAFEASYQLTPTIIAGNNPNSAQVGQSVVLTATIAATGIVTPTESLFFTNSTTNTSLGSATPDANGNAVLTTTFGTAGNFNIAVGYSGDLTFTAASTNFSQTVIQANTTTSLSSNRNPSSAGQSVTLMATVAAVSPGAGTPSGTVSFAVGNSIVTSTLSSGVATYVTSTLPVGSTVVTATYSGDSSYTSSTSNSVTQIVNLANTNIVVSSSANPSTYGQTITFTATIGVNTSNSVAHPQIAGDNTVSFTIDGNTVATELPATNNTATYITSTLSIGSHSIVASYTGSSNTNPSTSATFTQTVSKATPSVSLISSATVITQGQSTSFTATVSSSVGTPSGTVTFYDGSTQLGSAATLSNGVAIYSTASLSVGSHTIRATYSGDSNFNSVSSNSITVTVNSSNNGGDGNTIYTYYLPFVANTANNFTTYLAFQNIGTASANITVTYYDNNGNALTASTLITQVAQYAEALPTNPFANGKQGTGIISSDQPLNVIVPEATPYGGSAYAVASGSSNSLIAPFALNNAFGDFTTQLNIFNGGASAVTATVTFYGTVGNSTANTSSFTSVAIQPHTTANLNQNTLPSGFSGWAQISGSANTLVAQVLEQSPSTKFVAIANAVATPNSSEYAPAVFAGGYGGFYTGANIINPNSSAVTVTVTYYDLSANALPSTPFVIAAHGVASIFNGSSSGNGIPSGGLPKNFIGSMAVSAVGGNIAMSVNENGGVTSAGNSRSGTYAAIANGSSMVGLPVMSNGGFTYVTGDTILNTSSQPVSATINYYDVNGRVVSGASKSFTIVGHGSQAYYQGDGSLSSSFYGTAVITETGGVANSLIVTTNAQNIALFYTYSEPNS